MIPPRELDQTQPPASDATSAPPSDAATTPPSSAPSRRERFVAGAMVGSRYRIVAPLGRGGMGEVYRADDLELHQTVAIKFLPERLANDPLALDRLRSEVRIARQIAHPNVCRVYDMGQAGGEYFITMEFVDGEDLASVLRRLGAPSREKSLELARQICAGLSAAHELGVLHRDLKPANIMLDGRGRARITDFGLAGLATDLQSRREQAGTPAYMAPEQLRRGEVSRASDLYSLGLILLELFTGRSPNTGKRIDELLQTRDDVDVSGTISSLSDQLDPAIERVIQRCLAIEPADRPVSAMAVVAALPGGDPIAAALAAGETPSPQLVAASGESGLLPVRAAVALLSAALAGIFVQLFLGSLPHIVNVVPLPKSADVLADRAAELAKKLGAPLEPRDRAYGFVSDTDYVLHLAAFGDGPDRFAGLSQLAPAAIQFWYRQAPATLRPSTSVPGMERISQTNPPVNQPGMLSMELTPDGHLVRFVAIPPRWEQGGKSAASQPDGGFVLGSVLAAVPARGEATGKSATTQPSREFDFAPALAEAGFDPASLTPDTPRQVPVLPLEHRVAWVGKYPGSRLPARIEAGTFGGKLAYFSVIPPWDLPGYVAPAWPSWRNALMGGLQIVIFVGSAVMITVNFANRRGDKRGAMRLAAFVCVFSQTAWVLTSARFSAGLLPEFLMAFAFSLLLASLAWSLYMGLEPYIRRRSPYRLVSWSRLLDGRFRDPLVGRDILLGLTAASLAMIASVLIQQTLGRLMGGGNMPLIANLSTLGSPRQVWDLLCTLLLGSIIGGMMFLILPLIIQSVLRSWYLTIFVFWAFIAGMIGGPGFERSVASLIGAGLIWAATMFALYRFGMLAGVVAIFAVNLLNGVPLATNWSAWYATPGLIAGGVVAVLAVWGFYLALAGRSIFVIEGISKP